MYLFVMGDIFIKCLNMRVVITEFLVCVFQIQVTLPAETLALLSLEIKTTVKATRCENVATQKIEFMH